MPRHATVMSDIDVLRFISQRTRGVCVDDIVAEFGGSAETARRHLNRVADGGLGVRKVVGQGGGKHRYVYEVNGVQGVPGVAKAKGLLCSLRMAH